MSTEEFRHSHVKRASFEQIQCLKQMGIDPGTDLTDYGADKLIKDNKAKWESIPPTSNQEYFLRRRCQWVCTLTRGEAARRIEAIKEEEKRYI